ncbi:MAG: radical SAM protein [Methanobacterium sp.]
MMRKHFEGYNFVGIPETGITFRWGADFSEDPQMAPWPELADISISNYCTNGCSYCYRKSSEEGKFMSLEDYRFALQELTSEKYGSIFQVALGGGEPLLHPDFTEIIRITREEFGVIPNYTTSGKFFNPENIEATRDYCGAVAISWDPYRDLSTEELSKIGSCLKDKGILANIHYVISEATINDAVDLLNGKYDEYIKDFNSVIFLTYKPTGRAENSGSIKSAGALRTFLDLVDDPVTSIKIGFDACFVPVLMKATEVNVDLIDSCECGFFSVYIDENLDVTPCSFCNSSSYHYNLKQFSFEEIWESKFSDYRDYIDTSCKSDCVECDKISGCRGKCPFFDDLFLCGLLMIKK